MKIDQKLMFYENSHYIPLIYVDILEVIYQSFKDNDHSVDRHNLVNSVLKCLIEKTWRRCTEHIRSEKAEKEIDDQIVNYLIKMYEKAMREIKDLQVELESALSLFGPAESQGRFATNGAESLEEQEVIKNPVKTEKKYTLKQLRQAWAAGKSINKGESHGRLERSIT